MVRRLLIGIGAALLLSWSAATSAAINIALDYTYDVNNFFAVDSPARLTVEAAADFYSQILADTFSPVTVPAPYVSQASTGIVSWELNFTHPSTGASVGLGNAVVAADEYRLYAGARSLPGTAVGRGGYGTWSRDTNGGTFTQQEFDEYVQIRDAFESAVSTRGEATGFAAWGGSISFDTDADTVWHFDHTTSPAAGETDLFSVALHEIGHALGLGASDDWLELTSGSGDAAYFTGAATVAEHGGIVPLAFNVIEGVSIADKAHWRDGTMSAVYGSAMPQEAAMDPSLTNGKRKRLTALDAAALTDVGWTVEQPADLPGDLNHDQVVDAADYAAWRDGLGSQYTPADYQVWKSHFGQSAGSGAGSSSSAAVPEPATATLAFAAFFLAPALRRRTKSLCDFRRLLF